MKKISPVLDFYTACNFLGATLFYFHKKRILVAFEVDFYQFFNKIGKQKTRVLRPPQCGHISVNKKMRSYLRHENAARQQQVLPLSGTSKKRLKNSDQFLGPWSNA
jgi:uncharacterized C2H2 Zn-finger protein